MDEDRVQEIAIQISDQLLQTVVMGEDRKRVTIQEVGYKILQFKKDYRGTECMIVDESGDEHKFDKVEHITHHDIHWMISAIHDQFNLRHSEKSPELCSTEEWSIASRGDLSETEFTRFETQYDQNSVSVEFSVKDNEYIVDHPLQNGLPDSYESQRAAIMAALKIVYTYDSYEYDHTVRLRNAAKKQFKKLDNVIPRKDPVSDGIYEFSKFLDEIQSYASPSDRIDLREEVEEMVDNGEAPEDLPQVTELSAELVAESI